MADPDRDRVPGEIPNEIDDPDFQRRWQEARDLEWDEVETAWRHGFDARDRFADRPFEEVRGYLQQSWEAMRTSKEWDQVADIVESGYARYKGASLDSAADLAPEALRRFDSFTAGGGHTGPGELGEQPHLGGAEPAGEERA